MMTGAVTHADGWRLVSLPAADLWRMKRYLIRVTPWAIWM